jgi:5-methylcytosine-specific restriction endonuclease McrA
MPYSSLPTGRNEYFAFYKDERWKAKRIEILKRDNFKCRCCEAKTNLHVHHLHYSWDRKPWEYNNKALVTLCKECHERFHNDLFNEKNEKLLIQIANE